jgi:hypothetical protein
MRFILIVLIATQLFTGCNSVEAVHEAGHLIGLSDRYIDREDLDGCEVSDPNPGFENDVMGTYRGQGFSQIHYDNYVNSFSSKINEFNQGRSISSFVSYDVVDIYTSTTSTNKKGELKGGDKKDTTLKLPEKKKQIDLD